MKRSNFLTSVTAGAAALSAAPASAGTEQVLFETLASAPYPHPSRAAGHTYQGTLFDAAAHYSDSTVAIAVPPGFVQHGTVDLIVHFHGWNNNVRAVLDRYQLASQLAGSHMNAILVVPQGPRDAPDSGFGKLELDDGGFARFAGEVLQILRTRGVTRAGSRLGNVVLTAHSGGYGGAGGVLTRGGLNAHISDVVLFDAAYGYYDAFANWAKAARRNHLLSIFTGDTSTGNTALMGMLQATHPNLFVWLSAAITRARLHTRAATFILTTDVAHDELLQKYHWYELFLGTTALAPRD